MTAGLAEEATLLLLSPDAWRAIGVHGDASPTAVCAGFLLEDWVGGGPAPTEEELVRRFRKETYPSVRRAVDPLVAAGRVEGEAQPPGLAGRLRRLTTVAHWRVVDRDARQAIVDRLTASLGGTRPPPRRDAALAAMLFASKQWERTGLDGPEPRPRVVFGSDPQPWGPLGACAQQLAAGTVVPDPPTDPQVLPLATRALLQQVYTRTH